MELNEATICANPEMLREISKFLLVCAEEMEKDVKWNHDHFSPENKEENEYPELIVFNPNA